MMMDAHKSPNTISIDAIRHPIQDRDADFVTITLRQSRDESLERRWLLGTVPQTDVLMVTHERNVRSKSR